jgi:predicted DNA-binding protein (MmcQ/YjbR family)
VIRESLRALCAAKPGAVETHPFGPGVAVYKVGGKMFALVPHEAEPATVNLKCDPEWSELLRKAYDAVQPGYHQNKKHWNTVVLDGSVPDDELEELLAHSYELVVASLPRHVREEL